MVAGEATRRASDQAIVYADAGLHELKGKTELVRLWLALRVVSGARGALKSAGLEAPFVGRDRELRRIKDLFHTCADESKPQLISITGIGGIGKSRLAWEFYKYFDGLPQITYWHRGRCLSYGEGVTYWALPTWCAGARASPRTRSRRAPSRSSRRSSSSIRPTPRSAASSSHVCSTCSRSRKGASSGTTCSPPGACSSSGSPTSTRRSSCSRTCSGQTRPCSTSSNTSLSGRGTFRSSSSRLRVRSSRKGGPAGEPRVVTSRRSSSSRFPRTRCTRSWRASFRACHTSSRNGSSNAPRASRSTPSRRADAARSRCARPGRRGLSSEATIEALEVPETLHALVAARLDALSGEERRVLQDGAVLGKTFTKRALSVLSGLPSPSSSRSWRR